MNRELDGVYFRIKRGEKYESVCFSDMTEEEQNEVMNGRSAVWLREMCKVLARALKEIGDTIDIVGGAADEDI